MKLNLMEDFPTGVYDYNLMTSVFIALEPLAGRSAGLPVKAAFSAQEWCGQVWWQALFDPGEVAITSHSYFEDEAERSEVLALPADGGAEDGLFLWARGLAAPFLEEGASATVALVTSPRRGRLEHVRERPVSARLTWAASREEIVVPAGRFDALVHTAVLEDGARWTLWTGVEAPHLLLRWEDPRGAVALLRGSTRMRYWQRNEAGGEAALEGLGLEPRPAHTP
jgi:hypothetical protein